MSENEEMKKVFRDIKIAEELIERYVSMNIETPTTKQVKAIRLACEGIDIRYVGSPNNRLTWIAFVLPILHLIFKLPEDKRNQFICCVICSDYAMSIHISLLFEYLTVGLGIKSEAIYHEDNEEEIQEIMDCPHIFVASLPDLIKYFKKKGSKEFGSVRYLVFHDPEKFEKEHVDTLNAYLFNDLEIEKEKIQTFCFCNEMTPEVKDLMKRCRTKQKQFKLIRHDVLDNVMEAVGDGAAAAMAAAKAKGSSHIDKIEFFKSSILGKRDTANKLKQLIRVINSSKSKCMVIFTNSAAKVSALYSILRQSLLGYQVLECTHENAHNMEAVFGEYPYPEDKKAIIVCDDQTIFSFHLPIVVMYISYDILSPEVFSFRRYARTGRISDIGLSINIVQLVHCSERSEFQKVMEHVFYELDDTDPDRDFLEVRRIFMEKAREYTLQKCNEEALFGGFASVRKELLSKLSNLENEENKRKRQEEAAAAKELQATAKQEAEAEARHRKQKRKGHKQGRHKQRKR